MKYAKLVRLGGELIPATEADYQDYEGFLRCPQCGEPVFLRKAHQRGTSLVPAAFIHHKAVEGDECELRISRYSTEHIAQQNAIAKGQRLNKLRVSMWRFLKFNAAMDLKRYSKMVTECKKYHFIAETVDYGLKCLSPEVNIQFTLDTIERMSQLLLDGDERIVATREDDKKVLDNFIKSRKRDWRLHTRIAKECCELFLSSTEMSELRYRLMCCFCNPQSMAMMWDDLLDLDRATEEWRSIFFSYLTLEVALLFLTVDWISLLE